MFTPRPSTLAGRDPASDLIRSIPLDVSEDYGYECALPYLDRACTWTVESSGKDQEPPPPSAA